MIGTLTLTLILARMITYFKSIFNMSDVNCSRSGEGTDAVEQKTGCSLRKKFIKVLTGFRLRRVRQSVTNAGCSLLKKFVEVLKGWIGCIETFSLILKILN